MKVSKIGHTTSIPLPKREQKKRKRGNQALNPPKAVRHSATKPGKKFKKNRFKHFIFDGFWSSICEGSAESNLPAYATSLLQATPPQLSFFLAAQSFLGAALQFWSEQFVLLFKRQKRVVLGCVTLQLCILAFILFRILNEISPYTFLFLTFFYNTVGSLSSSVWNSWISNLLPEKRRGFYFGARNRKAYLANFFSVLAAGVLLQKGEAFFNQGKLGLQFAFFGVFALGLFGKILALRHLIWQPEAKFHPVSPKHSPLHLLLENVRISKYRRMFLYFGFTGFAISFAAAFQVPYMLNQLHLDYMTFTSSIAIYVAARFLVAPWIGQLVDQKGSKVVLVASTCLMPLISLGWAFAQDYRHIFVLQFLTGVLWAGFDLCSFTYLAEITSKDKRQTIFTLKNVIWSLSSGLGATAGGFVYYFYPNYVLLFLISVGVRAVGGFFSCFLDKPVRQPNR